MTFRGRNLTVMPTAGVYDGIAAQNIPDANVSAAQNVRFRFEDWLQRGGYAPHISAQAAAAAVNGIRFAKYSNGNSRLYAATAAIAGSAGLWRVNGGAWTSIKGALTLTGGANALYSFAELNDLTIGSNGVDQLFKVSDGTDPAVALGGSPPANAAGIGAYRNRIIAVGPSAQVDGVFWSGIGNQDDWTSAAAGSARPGINQGQKATAFAAVGTDAFIFYERMIFAMNATGDNKAPFRFDEHNVGGRIGAASQSCVISVPDRGLIFFANALGIFMMSAETGYLPSRISKRIDGTWKTVNKTRVAQIFAGVLPDSNEVWFTVSTGSNQTNSLVLVYDYERDCWNGSFVGINANCLANADDSNGNSRLLFGDYSGFVYDTETGSQDMPATAGTPAGVATAIDAFVSSKAYKLIDGRRRSSVWEVDFECDGGPAGGTIQFNFAYDLSTINQFRVLPTQQVGAQYDVDNWDVGMFAAEGPLNLRLKPGGIGHTFQFQFRNNLINTAMRVYGVKLGLIDEGRFTPEEAAA